MIQQIDNKITVTFDKNYISNFDEILYIKEAIQWAISHMEKDSYDQDTIFWLTLLDKELTPTPNQVDLKINPL